MHVNRAICQPVIAAVHTHRFRSRPKSACGMTGRPLRSGRRNPLAAQGRGVSPRLGNPGHHDVLAPPLHSLRALGVAKDPQLICHNAGTTQQAAASYMIYASLKQKQMTAYRAHHKSKTVSRHLRSRREDATRGGVIRRVTTKIKRGGEKMWMGREFGEVGWVGKGGTRGA
jgi:hypothetical protein